MSKSFIGVSVARKLRTTEHAVDKAMIETAALIQAMIEGRAGAGLAAEVGQPVLVTMIRSLSQMAEARGTVVAGHAALATVADEHGIGWRLDGPLEGKTDPAGRVVPIAA